MNNYDSEILPNKRTCQVKNKNIERLRCMPKCLRKQYMSETELQKEKIYFFINYSDSSLYQLLNEISLPYELRTVNKDIFNIFDNISGGTLYAKNGRVPIFILVPRKDAISINLNASEDVKVLRSILSKYKVNVVRGGRRQGLSTHYATFGTSCNRYKAGLSSKLPYKTSGDEYTLLRTFFNRADSIAKKFLPYGVLRWLKECKDMCGDKNSYVAHDENEKSNGIAWSSIATTYNYMSPAHTDEDAFMSSLFVSHIPKDKEKPAIKVQYEMDQEVAMYFCFPTEGVAVALRPGDVLMFNPVFYHCASQRCDFYKLEDIFLTSLYLKNKQLSRNENELLLTTKSEWFSQISQYLNSPQKKSKNY